MASMKGQQLIASGLMLLLSASHAAANQRVENAIWAISLSPAYPSYVTTMASKDDEPTQLRKQRQFVQQNYQALREAVARGEGETLTALAQLYNVAVPPLMQALRARSPLLEVSQPNDEVVGKVMAVADAVAKGRP